ncbi:MAG: hypothetical protein LBT68_05460 [Spirochaetales bacterium]|jgi:hypothetical protein|nr:hypothetical protein [Spirochaetales bacterium]
MKKMSIFSIFLALCVLVPGQMYAQARPGRTASEREIPTGIGPFVSRLKAAVKGTQVKLTWQDADDQTVDYVIYRHTQEITARNFSEATMVVRLMRGLGVYIDTPPQVGEFFYAVLSISPWGILYNTLIPFRNKTSAGTRVETTMPVQELAAGISQLAARAEQNGIVITFTASRADRNLMLFRSTSPIFLPAQILAARGARRIKSVETRIVDFPVPGIPYYYALLDQELLNAGDITLEIGRNTTTEPAEIPLKEESFARMFPLDENSPSPPAFVSPFETATGTPGRPTPLPYYILDSKVSVNESLQQPVSAHIPVYRTLSLAAEKAVQNILLRTNPPPAKPAVPVILEADSTEGLDREDYTLKTIILGAFSEEKWSEAEKQLTHFMNMYISDAARTRAHFYKGQVLFFQKRYEESFMNFLLAMDGHYTQIEPWLSKILEMLKVSGTPGAG